MFGGLLVDMLYLFNLLIANNLPSSMENFQLCTNSPRCSIDIDNALVGLGCKEMVQGTGKGHLNVFQL